MATPHMRASQGMSRTAGPPSMRTPAGGGRPSHAAPRLWGDLRRSAPPAVLQAKAAPRVIQAQYDTGIASAAALTQANWTAVLRRNQFKNYVRDHEPGFASQDGDAYGGTTYTLTWTNAVRFNDGNLGTVKIHIHERGMDGTFDGGGAWVDGGAPGHGVNVDVAPHVKNVCIEWLEDHYALV